MSEDTYEDRVSSTTCGDIRVYCGGYTIVKPLERWPEGVWGEASVVGCLSEEQMSMVSEMIEARIVGEASLGKIRE